MFCLARSAVAGRGEVVERGPGSSGTPAVSGILHIGVDTSGEATDWSGVRLVLVTGTETRGRLNLRTKTLARFVQIAPTLEAALASIRRPPICAGREAGQMMQPVTRRT